MEMPKMELTERLAQVALGIEAKVHRYVVDNRIRLDTFFFAYDRLRHRHITRAQFLRALNMAMNNSLILSREEELALFAKYSRDDTMVNYRDFCDTCTKIQRGLETTPLEPVWFEHLIDNHPRNRLPPKDEQYFEQVLLPKLQQIAREQGFVVKMSFMDFDFNRNGCVTKGQFLRGLPDKYQIACTAHEIHILCEKYKQADLYGKYNDVCYHALHIDVSCADPALTLPDGLKDEDYRKTKPGRIPVLSELERKIRAVSRERRLLMCPFFDDYDRLHSGYVTQNNFARVCCTLGLDYFHEELITLGNLYQSEEHKDKWVNYKAFAAEMETPADSIRSILQDLFDRLRRECSARGAHGLHGLLSAFSLVESGGRGKVKLEDFKSILPQCGISISRAEMDALFSHFGVGGGSVDYIGFVGEVRGCLNRIRKAIVVDAFKNLTNEVGHVDMQALSERLNPAWHPQVMAGQMAPRSVMDDMVEGTDLMRAGTFTIEDFCDYWSFIGHHLSDADLEKCARNIAA